MCGKDVSKATEYFRHAELWNGFWFFCGIGVRIDLSETVHYYQLSADHGNSIGQLFYGHGLRFE
jgi:TPR repeat protein